MTHTLMIKFNEQPKNRVLIVSTISKGKKSLKVLDVDATENTYRELDVEIYDHRGKE